MFTASDGVMPTFSGTTTVTGMTVLAETVGSTKAPMEWWAVGLVTIGAILLLGLVITIMTLADRKRHPHPHAHPRAEPQEPPA